MTPMLKHIKSVSSTREKKLRKQRFGPLFTPWHPGVGTRSRFLASCFTAENNDDEPDVESGTVRGTILLLVCLRRRRIIMKKRSDFTRLIQLWGIIFLSGFGVCILLIEMIGSSRDFNSRAAQMRLRHIDQQKQLIKREVYQVVDYINFKKAQREALTQTKIKTRVYEAYSIAHTIYQQNKSTKSKAEIQKIIIDALRAVRFENESGYYFINRMDGVAVLSVSSYGLEGENLINLSDANGKYMVREMIDVAEKSGEGFCEYYWKKPNAHRNDYKKISFIKRFEPFNWFIGTGLYVDDVEAQIESELLVTISKIRFGKEGYIFVNRLNGNALVANGKLFSGTKKVWEVFNKYPKKMQDYFAKAHNAAFEPDGDYIYYSHIKLTNPDKDSPKVSFIYGLPDMQWLVGAGVYLDDVEADIIALQIELNNQIKVRLVYLITTTLIIGFFFLVLFNRLSRRLNTDFDLFISFFQKAASSDESINRDLIQFNELDRIAENVNRMLSDRREAEDALRLNEAKLEDLSCDWIWEMSKDGFYTYASPQVETILGYRPDEITGRSLSDLSQTGDPRRNGEIIREMMEKTGENLAFEHVKLHKDGRPVFLERSGVPIFDQHGTLTGYRGIDRDITERKRSESELIQAQAYITNIIDSMPSVLIGVDAGGVITQWNLEAANMTGVNSETAVGKKIGEVIPRLASEMQRVEKAIKTRTVQVETQRSILNENDFYFEDITVFPLITNGAAGAVIRLDNVTDRVRMKEMMIQSEKMLSVGGLAAGMAHEINNPLAGMMQTADVMQNRLTDVEMPANRRVAEENNLSMQGLKVYMEERGILRMLSTICESGLRVAGIVDNMLSFARKGDDRIESIDLTELIDKTLELASTDYDFKQQYDFKLIQIEKEYEREHYIVSCEGGKIQQVLLNIFRNGAQVMQEAGVEMPRLIIRLHRETERDMVVIEIEDNGPGMDEETCKRVFEPFFTTKPSGVGTGLGLSVSYFIITETHGGEMTIESRHGSGANFIIRLPVERKGVTE